MKLIKIILLVFVSYFSFIPTLNAQGCCTAGSSTFGGLERGNTNYGSLNLSLSFIHNGLNTTYNERTEITDPLNRTASVSSFNIEFEYGLAEQVSILVIGGYVVKNRETTVTSNETNDREVISFKGKGIGDITILGKYEIISPNIVSQFGLAVGGGAKLPVGSYTQEKDGSRLAIDLQPGTGSTDVLMWGNVYKGFLPLNFSLFGNVLYRYAGSNLTGYRFGDEFIFSINGEYYLTTYLNASLSLRGRFAAEDFWGGRFLPSTGGTYYDLIPSIIYTESSLSLKLFYVAPVYRSVRGIQLTTSNTIGVELLYGLNLLNTEL
ncbi:MAG: hypothetical protein WBQ32_00445 [Ignavibacteriaceae bacterium]